MAETIARVGLAPVTEHVERFDPHRGCGSDVGRQFGDTPGGLGGTDAKVRVQGAANQRRVRHLIADIVEREFLGVAKSVAVDFEPRAVELAAKDRAGRRVGEHPTVAGRDVITAVTDGEVEPSVGTEEQAVQVVAPERHPDAVAVGEDHPPIGLAVAFLIDQLPKLGDTGVIDVVAANQDARPRAFLETIESVGKHLAAVDAPVVVGVNQTPDSVVVLGVSDRRFTQQTLVVIDAVLHRLRSQIREQPLRIVSPIVGHAAVLAKRLADVRATFPIDVEGDHVGDIRFGRQQTDPPRFGQANHRHRLPGFVRSLGDVGRERFGFGDVGGPRWSRDSADRGQQRDRQETGARTNQSTGTSHIGHRKIALGSTRGGARVGKIQ